MFSRVSVAVLLAVLLALVGTGAAAADGPVQWADWPEHPAPIQLETLARFYEAAEYHGLRDADRDLLIRLGYRETLLGLAVWGDCYGPGGFCYSAGAASIMARRADHSSGVKGRSGQPRAARSCRARQA